MAFILETSFSLKYPSNLMTHYFHVLKNNKKINQWVTLYSICLLSIQHVSAWMAIIRDHFETTKAFKTNTI